MQNVQIFRFILNTKRRYDLSLQLVCGSKVFDFAELEAATEYEGGYTVDSEAVRNFWRVAHSLPLESQRRLLQFTTGSDRVPVGGLSRLKMVIARHGPDSDRYDLYDSQI